MSVCVSLEVDHSLRLRCKRAAQCNDLLCLFCIVTNQNGPSRLQIMEQKSGISIPLSPSTPTTRRHAHIHKRSQSQTLVQLDGDILGIDWDLYIQWAKRKFKEPLACSVGKGVMDIIMLEKDLRGSKALDTVLFQLGCLYLMNGKDLRKRFVCTLHNGTRNAEIKWINNSAIPDLVPTLQGNVLSFLTRTWVRRSKRHVFMILKHCT